MAAETITGTKKRFPSFKAGSNMFPYPMKPFTSGLTTTRIARTTPLCKYCDAFDPGRMMQKYNHSNRKQQQQQQQQQQQGNARKHLDIFWPLPWRPNLKQCPLCRVVNACVSTTKSISREDLCQLNGFICGKYSPGELTLSLHVTCPFNPGADPYCKMLTCSVQFVEAADSSAEAVAPAPAAAVELHQNSSSYAPAIRTWLLHCRENHTRGYDDDDKPCRYPCITPGGGENRIGKKFPATFRLVDVYLGCVVSGVLAEERPPSYWALSYARGLVYPFMAAKWNINTLTHVDALFTQIILPRTVTDAMTLCRSAGQRYLWIDLLCILHDDEDDKRIHMRATEAIFGAADLVIVAASGDDLDAGLPMCRPPRRSDNDDEYNTWKTIPEESIHNSSVRCRPQFKAAIDELCGSAWIRRAWTFQEYALARRTAIFTRNGHLILTCESEQALPHGPIPLGLTSHGLPMFTIRPPRGERNAASQYQAAVSLYALRHLGRNGDAVDAIQGILCRLFGDDEDGGHFGGLPRRNFARHLLWNGDAAATRERRGGMPSWSWAGWIHEGRVGWLNDGDGSEGSMSHYLAVPEAPSSCSTISTKHVLDYYTFPHIYSIEPSFRQGEPVDRTARRLAPPGMPDLTRQCKTRDQDDSLLRQWPGDAEGVIFFRTSFATAWVRVVGSPTDMQQEVELWRLAKLKREESVENADSRTMPCNGRAWKTGFTGLACFALVCCSYLKGSDGGRRLVLYALVIEPVDIKKRIFRRADVGGPMSFTLDDWSFMFPRSLFIALV